MWIRRIYNKLPSRMQLFIHLLIVRIDTNRILLFMFGYIRHKSTVRRLNRSSESILLRLGESEKSSGWVCTNYETLAANFLDARRPYKTILGVKYIVADNVIEHLNLRDGYLMLENAFSALLPGGKIRLATPDLRNIAEAYLKENQASIEQFKENFGPHGIRINSFADLFHATFHYFGHEHGYIYDFAALEEVLDAIGFVEIKQYLSGESDVPELRNIEKRMKSSDMWGQLCVEARKPYTK